MVRSLRLTTVTTGIEVAAAVVAVAGPATGLADEIVGTIVGFADAFAGSEDHCVAGYVGAGFGWVVLVGMRGGMGRGGTGPGFAAGFDMWPRGHCQWKGENESAEKPACC